MRRPALAVMLVAMLACVAAPAAAQRAITVKLSGVDEGSVLQGTVTLEAEASAGAGVRRLTMWIDGDVVAEVAPSGLRQNAEATFDWDTTQYVTSNQLARNRVYQVRVKAVANGGGEDETTATVIVDNAPSVPTSLEGQASDNEITLTWDANPEPDILGYRVERFYGTKYVKTAFVTEPTFSQEREPGRYSYRVIAVRHSEQNRKGIVSTPTTPLTVAVAAPGTSETGSSGGGAGGPKDKRAGRVRHTVTRRIGAGGLPRGAALPSGPGMSGLPDVPDALAWGSYEKQLPYKLPKGGVPIEAAPARNVVTETLRVIPPDGLRWVAAGLLMLVTAALARLVAMRLQASAAPAKIEA